LPAKLAKTSNKKIFSWRAKPSKPPIWEYASRMSLTHHRSELGNSHTTLPSYGRETASVRRGGRRRRSSRMPGCNGQDRVKVRQGKPTQRQTNGWRTECRWREASISPPGAPFDRQRSIRPWQVGRPNWKAACREIGLRGLERGKDRKVLPIATVRREVASVIVLGVPTRQNLLSHQQYSRRSCGEVTNRTKPADNVADGHTAAIAIVRTRSFYQRRVEKG